MGKIFRILNLFVALRIEVMGTVNDRVELRSLDALVNCLGAWHSATHPRQRGE